MPLILRVFLTICVTSLLQGAEKKFLESYGGQTVQQLIAMEEAYRTDSLVLAFEQALQAKAEKKKTLSQAEQDVLAIEAMEREVNNGGFHQFMLNDSHVYASALPDALRRIGCPKASAIAADALRRLEITGPVTPAKIKNALKTFGESAASRFAETDRLYFANKEAIADQLFDYIKANARHIDLK
jgi:hypothetical protein